MTVAWISQQGNVSHSHAVPYEEIYVLLLSQFFFENAKNQRKEALSDKLLHVYVFPLQRTQGNRGAIGSED